MERNPRHQEPITWSLHLPYILESPFARIFLFLGQSSPQASLNSQESILYSVWCGVVSYGMVWYGVMLWCILKKYAR